MKKMKMLVASLLVACMLLPMMTTITTKAAADAVSSDGGITVTSITSNSAVVDWRGMINAFVAKGYSFTGVTATLTIVFGSASVEKVLCEKATDVGGGPLSLYAGTYYQIAVSVYGVDEYGIEHSDYDWVDFTTDGTAGNTPVNPTPINPTVTTQAPAPALTVATPTVANAEIDETMLYANAAGCDGYTKYLEWQVLDVKNGNKVVKTDTSYSTDVKMYSMARKIYAVQCRAVAYDANYNKVYSNWSAKKYVVSQPKRTTKKSNIKYHSVKVTFKKIKGASSYTVYMRKHNTKKWTKVKTIKGNTITLTKFKGKTMNLESPSYDVCIVTNAKVGGKKIKSSKYEGTRYYIERY